MWFIVQVFPIFTLWYTPTIYHIYTHVRDGWIYESNVNWNLFITISLGTSENLGWSETMLKLRKIFKDFIPYAEAKTQSCMDLVCFMAWAVGHFEHVVSWVHRLAGWASMVTVCYMHSVSVTHTRTEPGGNQHLTAIVGGLAGHLRGSGGYLPFKKDKCEQIIVNKNSIKWFPLHPKTKEYVNNHVI